MSNEIPVIDMTQKVKGTASLNQFWWQEKEAKYSHIRGVVNSINNNQSYRKADNTRYARLYANTDFERFISGTTTTLFGKKLTFNVAKACVNTACAKISKTRPRPIFLTSKGNFSQQKRAKNLTKYIDGCFGTGQIFKAGKKAFRDACIFGTGILKVFERDGQMQYERVFIEELKVDEVEGRDGTPRQLHQVKTVNRQVLKMMYPGFDSQIDGAQKLPTSDKTGSSDLIMVTESWHLKSNEDADDGVHVVSIEGADLLDEEWPHPFFPFVFTRWSEPILGFFGDGLVAEVVGIQLEINSTLLNIKEALEVMAVPRIFLEEGSSVKASSITDEIGGIIRYRGTPPSAQTWQGMTAETYQWLEYLYKKAFEETGISQLSAASKKPAGLDSGVAIREYQDIETERFALVAQNYQDMYLDAAKITIAIQREIYKEDKKLSVNVKGKGFIETIKWKDVDIEDDKYVMELYPTNLLPKEPAGRLQFTQELIQSGFIDQEEGLTLLDFPDLESFFSLKTAAIDDINMILEMIIEDQEYTPPEEYMNIRLALKMSQAAYLRAKTNGTSEVSQELLLRFIDECTDIMAKMTPPPAPPGPGAPGGPGGAPTPPPVGGPAPIANGAPPPQSDLLPFQQ